MEPAQDILEELVCVQCGSQLRRGPVFQRQDGAACSPCQEQEGAPPAFRCHVYEAAARALAFPCRYREEGCPASVPFTPAGADGPGHEAACQYRLYTCPVLGPEGCDWAGRRDALRQHCEAQHPDRVLPCPALVTPDIRRSTSANYIVPAYEQLFLLLTRVCVASGSLFYSVRLLGEPQAAADYDFSVAVRRGRRSTSYSHPVLPQERLHLKQHSALAVNVSSVLGVLGGWDGATLAVEVRRHEAEAPLEECGRCRAPTARLYRDKDQGWLCEACAPALETCDNRGCNFQDFPEKRDKHIWYWCEQRRRCGVCWTDLQPGTLAQHYQACRALPEVPAGAGHRVPRDPEDTWFRVGDVLCWCEYPGDMFRLRVHAPVAGRQLPGYRCEVRLECAGHTRTYTPPTTYHEPWDWEVECKFLVGDVTVHNNQPTISNLLVHFFIGHTGAITAISFSENGYYLATAADDSCVNLWDLRKLKNFKTLQLNEEGNYQIRDLCFDQSGTYLAVCGTDVQVYLCKQWQELKVFNDHTATATGIRFGKHAQYIAFTSMDRTLKLYAL